MFFLSHLKVKDIHHQQMMNKVNSVIYPDGHKTCIHSIEYFPSSNNFLTTDAIDSRGPNRP